MARSRQELGGLKRSALALVNKGRLAFGWEPLPTLPKGNKTEPSSCPLAVAFNGEWAVGGSDIEGLSDSAYNTLAKAWGIETSYDPDYGHPDWLELPPKLADFVDAFDNGEMPELVEEDQ